MYLLSCGRSSLGATDVDPRSRDQSSDSESSMASAIHPVASPEGASANVELRQPRGSMQRLENAMTHYDSMAARLKSASRADFPALWTDGGRRSTKRGDQLTTSTSGDVDEASIPEHHVGIYHVFCQPHTWSPVFASPGEFTLRMESTMEVNGATTFRIAIICCSLHALRESGVAASTQVPRRKSYVKTVERTDQELSKFAETMALKYLGHNLMDKLPTLVLSVLTTSEQLQAHGEAVASFLCYLLSITAIGYNRLVDLTEPVAKNLFVREFLDLSLGFGDPGMKSTSSCDARLERPAEIRSLPAVWVSAVHSGANSRSHSIATPADESKPAERPTIAIHPTSSHEGKCYTFVRPSRWRQDCKVNGAFTVEIAGVTITEGRARYTIAVLFYVNGKLEMATVDRRYSEFDAMVNHVERKLRALPVRNHFPTKTLFRYLSIAYLERRAAYLQRFLEKLLQMRFLGVLDQEISMVAEPNVRKFLQLPVVQWSITPWQAGTTTPRRSRRTPRGGSTASSAFASSSPRVYSDSLSSSDSIGVGPYDIIDAATPRDRYRSGSM